MGTRPKRADTIEALRTEMRETLASLGKQLQQLSTKVDRLDADLHGNASPTEDFTLTSHIPDKTLQTLEFVSESEDGGLEVKDLARNRNISYHAAYEALERLIRRGIVKKVKASKGNKQKYVRVK